MPPMLLLADVFEDFRCFRFTRHMIFMPAIHAFAAPLSFSPLRCAVTLIYFLRHYDYASRRMLRFT